MTGHATAERLSSYLDDQLGEREARDVADHLSRCVDCRRQLEGLRRVVGELRSLEQSRPPEGLGLRLQQRLVREAPPLLGRGALGGHRFPRPLFQPAILASLGVIIALAVVMVLFIQQLEHEVGGGTLFGIKPSEGIVQSGPVEVAGRTFELMGGIWVESDLTVAEVAAAEVKDRAALLASVALPADVRKVLTQLEREVTLRVADDVLRVPVSSAD